MTTVHLELRSLEKRFGDLAPSVSALSLSLGRGELLGILGPSGCGKTTTLRMIAGLVPATAGHILVDGRDVTRVPTHRRNMGVMFQSYALFPHMTLEGNVAFGLEMRGLRGEDVKARVRRALDMVRLGHVAGRRPRELSGGQQQRVALARALVIEPAILLLDEPLSNLDAKLRDEMRNEIREIQQELAITSVFVTHDQVEAMAICDRIAVMNAGRLEQIGSPIDIYERPASPFVAAFVGRINRLPGRRTAPARGEFAGRSLAVAQTGPVGEDLLLMVRPHRVRIERGPGTIDRVDALPATVRRVTFVGDAFHYEVDAAGHMLVVEERTDGQPPHSPGKDVQLAWRPEDTLVFPAGQPA